MLLEVSDLRLERRRELLSTSENINVKDGVTVFDYNSRYILHYLNKDFLNHMLLYNTCMYSTITSALSSPNLLILVCCPKVGTLLYYYYAFLVISTCLFLPRLRA